MGYFIAQEAKSKCVRTGAYISLEKLTQQLALAVFVRILAHVGGPQACPDQSHPSKWTARS